MDYTFAAEIKKNISMKKVFMFVVMLCCALSGFAEETPIELKEKGGKPNERTGIQLPTASIDGQVLTISFVSNCDFEVSVVDEVGVVVYTSTYNAQGAIITLPNLPVGDYELEIEDVEYLYSGEFEIE